jgi:putative transposase
MNRGAARQKIFLDDAGRQSFLDCLVTASNLTNTEIHGYCLMGNHFHLLVCSREANLSEFLKQLSGRYTRIVNKRTGRDGPLFRGRSNSVLINDDAQLIQTSRYIHLNPVVAGLIEQPEDWPWSSAAHYLDPGSSPSWLHFELILDMFATWAPGGGYRRFLREGVDPATRDFYSRLLWNNSG